MKFLSDILAKAGLTVDGVVTLNNTATGQTPATNDNSTKLATTEFIKNQSYLSANQTITVSGDATGSGTTSIALTLANSGVTAGTYGNASNIPTIIVDAKGRITSISTNAVSIVTTLAGLSDVTLTSPSANQVLQYNGTQWVNGAAPTTYTLPIATSSILGGIKVGTGLSIDPTTGVLTASGGSGGSFNFRTIQEFTATSGQSTFTISGGYVVGYVEVLINGVYLSESLYTATNGTTIVLDEAAATDDIVTVFLYSIYNFGGNIYARQVDTLTATAGQTSFTTSYIPGQIDVYYNGSKLTAAEFTATSGTAIVLAQAAAVGDIIEVVTYLAGAGLNASRTLTINGTTYDLTANRTWTLTTANISEVTNLYYTDARARAAISVTGSGSYNSSTGIITVTGGVTSVNTLTGAVVLTTTDIAEGTNLYYTQARFDTAFTAKSTTNLTEGTNLYYTTARANADFDTRLATKSTTNLSEGINLYYTDTRVGTYLTNNSYATQTYVNTAVSNLVDAAPGTLDTLNELAAALGDDPNFATTVATSIGTKEPAITAGTTGQYWRGDKSWQTLPIYTLSGLGGVPTTRTITINGTALDLSADRSFTIAGGVTSFNTRTGAITPTSGDYTTAQVTESGNLYYTDARARLALSGSTGISYNNTTGAISSTITQYTDTLARASISLSTTGTSGAATYDSATGVLNIPQYQGGVTSFNTRTGAITLSSSDVTTALTYTPVTNARTITINGTSYDLSANRSWTIAPDVSVRNTYAFTATAAQTTFTVTGGYSVGLVDVFINGVKLAAADFTATNGTTVVLGTGTGVGNIVEIVKYVSAFTTAVETTRTLTINGTTYDLSANRTWSIDTASLGAQAQLNGTGLVRMAGTTVSYDNATYATQSYVTTAVANLVNSAPSTLDTLNELATALGNDANFATTITTSIATKQPQLNGTGFVKISGTTISYDNSTYLTTSSAASTYLQLVGGTLSGNLNFAQPVGLAFANGQYIRDNGSGGLVIYSGAAVNITATSLTVNNTATFSSTGSFGNATLNGAYLVVKGANGVPASSGTTTTAVFRVSSGTGLYNVLDFGTNESDDYSWIQSTRANSLGTYDRLLIQPNGGAVRIGGTGLTSYKLLVDGTLGVTGAVTFSSTLNTNGNITSNADIIANGGSSTAIYVYNSSSIRAKLSMTGNEGDLTLYSSSGVAKIYLSAYYNSYFNAGNVIVGGTSDFNKGAKFQITQNSSNTNAIDFKNSDATYSHIGTFANNMYLTQNYYYAGGQNADNSSYGQAAITMGVGTTSGSSYIDFAMSDPGATSPSGKIRIAGNGHFMVGTTTDYSFWPSWDGSVIRIGQGGAIWHYRDSMLDFMISSNYYISSSGAQETRMAAGGAANIYMNNGNILFRTSAVGTAGSSISWINALNLTNAGDAIFPYGIQQSGLWTVTSTGYTTGDSAFTFDVGVGDEGGGGNVFKVEAGFAHYSGMSYNCLAEFYITTRSTASEITDVLRRDTTYAGSFTAFKTTGSVLRVAKNAGTYPGGGRYWIRVTKVTY